MKKIELSSEHIEKIDYAVRIGLCIKDWEPINLLSGGLTGIPVYRILVENKSYAIKLENINDKNFDLNHTYEIIQAVSKKGISPTVYFTDASQGVVLMQYIESQPRSEASSKTIKKLADVIRNLHETQLSFKWKTVVEVLELIYNKLTPAYKKTGMIKKVMNHMKNMKSIIFDTNDIRLCHCDLNPANILFDGDNYFFVDWQAASPQSFYFDLAYCANWFYFYNEDLCKLLLDSYLEREASKEEGAKYYLMRAFVYIYLGMSFISLPLKENIDFPVLSNQDIKNLSPYSIFMQSIGQGKVNLGDSYVQQQFGFILLKAAIEMLDHRYEYAYESLTNIKNT